MNRFQGKRAVVTGAGGFVGSHLVPRLGQAGCHVIRLTRHSPSEVTSELDREDLVGDVRDAATWQQLRTAPDFVFHLAAQTSIYVADRDPAADWQANGQPMLHLLELCRTRGWRPGIVFAGSATQFGLTESVPVGDFHPDRPVTIYDCHKNLAEGYLAQHVAAGRGLGVTLRLANVYGPGPLGAPDRGILNQMVRRGLRGEALSLYGRGEQQRDYVFIDDVVDAFLAAALHLDRLQTGHFVIGSGEGHTLAGAFALVADGVARLTGKRPQITSVAPPATLSPIENRNFIADSSRFRDLTGWRPRVSLVEGIDRTARALHVPAPS